jgi:small subunit ribosomal protein S8
MMTDPIADMLTRLRNANLAQHERVDVPRSRLKVEIAKLLKREGFITDYQVLRQGPQGTLRIVLKYTPGNARVLTGLRRVSRPGLRVYAKAKAIPRFLSGLGVTIVSTPKGVMTGREAREQRLGGEVLCAVW